MSKYIIVERQQLEDLRLKLLNLRDFIQDLEYCITLLNIPFSSSQRYDPEFLEYLIDIATDQFPSNHCQEFKEATDKARYILGELLK